MTAYANFERTLQPTPRHETPEFPTPRDGSPETIALLRNSEANSIHAVADPDAKANGKPHHSIDHREDFGDRKVIDRIRRLVMGRMAAVQPRKHATYREIDRHAELGTVLRMAGNGSTAEQLIAVLRDSRHKGTRKLGQNLAIQNGTPSAPFVESAQPELKVHVPEDETRQEAEPGEYGNLDDDPELEAEMMEMLEERGHL